MSPAVGTSAEGSPVGGVVGWVGSVPVGGDWPGSSASPVGVGSGVQLPGWVVGSPVGARDGSSTSCAPRVRPPRVGVVLGAREATLCSEGRRTMPSVPTADALSRATRPSSSPSVGGTKGTNVAAARSRIPGRGTTVAASESSGIGMHVRRARTTTCGRDKATASAARGAAHRRGVAMVSIQPQNPCAHRIKLSTKRASPDRGWFPTLERVNTRPRLARYVRARGPCSRATSATTRARAAASSR